MRESQTAVLERKAIYTGDFTTEPFETAWAAEARWFARVMDLAAGTTVRMVTQVSPDGLTWVDHESPAMETTATGLVTAPVREFGAWLRLRGCLDGPDPSARLMIYLALKS
jgi:hypothetical protein